jgi:hypothetical protein
VGRRPLGGVLANDHGVEDGHDLVGGNFRAASVLADGCRVDRFINAYGANATVGFLDDIGADPSDPVGHVDVADLGRPRRCFFEIGNVGKSALSFLFSGGGGGCRR